MLVPATTDELDQLISKPTDGVLRTVTEASGTYAVLGAAGKMGFHISCMLSRALEAAGRKEQVTVVSRFNSSAARRQFEAAGFVVHRADLSEQEQVESLPDADNVFFLAGVKFGSAGNTDLLQQMNVIMPRLVAARYRLSRIVALSTGCVYGFVSPESGGSTEDSLTNPPGDYARSCLGREQAFADNAQRYGTPTSLIRLNYSNELRYGVLVDIAAKVLAGEELSLDTGYVNVIWQGDAVAHVVQSLSYATAPPFVLNVTGQETLSVRDLAEMFGRRFNRTPHFTGSPGETAWLNNASKSHRLFGTPSVSVEQMVDWIAHWLTSGGSTLGKPTRFEVRTGEY